MAGRAWSMALLSTLLLLISGPADAGLLSARKPEAAQELEGVESLTYRERSLYVHVPPQLPASGTRALVVVLHGGLGSAEGIVSKRSDKEWGLNLNDVSDKYGFVVAYMNGTPVMKRLGRKKMRGWNAGECCGESSDSNVDDIGYLTGAIAFVAQKYGIDPRHMYGVGHSNGAMMTQRLICEKGIYASGVSISGALAIETDNCPGARGRSILEIHGADDSSVPIEGGNGDGISSKYPKRSQEYSHRTFTGSGAQYTLHALPGAGHKLVTIENAVKEQENTTLQEKIAQFFKLTN